MQTFAQLFNSAEKQQSEIAIRLMVLGDSFGYWQLINPFKEMRITDEKTKLILSGLGCFSVKISDNYIKDCVNLMKNIEILTQKQTNNSLQI